MIAQNKFIDNDQNNLSITIKIIYRYLYNFIFERKS